MQVLYFKKVFNTATRRVEKSFITGKLISQLDKFVNLWYGEDLELKGVILTLSLDEKFVSEDRDATHILVPRFDREATELALDIEELYKSAHENAQVIIEQEFTNNSCYKTSIEFFYNDNHDRRKIIEIKGWEKA